MSDLLCVSSRFANYYIFFGDKDEMICSRLLRNEIMPLVHIIDAVFYYARSEIMHCARCIETDKIHKRYVGRKRRKIKINRISPA